MHIVTMTNISKKKTIVKYIEQKEKIYLYVKYIKRYSFE